MAHFEWAKTDIECLNQAKEIASLHDAIGYLERHYQSRGMVVCSFSVNGMKLSEEDESRLSTAPFHDVKTVDVWVEPVSHLLSMTLENGEKFIVGLVDACHRIADQFRTGSRDEAFYALRKVIDGVQMLHDLAAQMIHMQGHGQGELLKLQVELLKVAQSLVQSMQAKDVVVLADGLEYDLPETLINWRSQFAIIKTELMDRNTGVEAT